MTDVEAGFLLRSKAPKLCNPAAHFENRTLELGEFGVMIQKLFGGLIAERLEMFDVFIRRSKVRIGVLAHQCLKLMVLKES